MALCLGFPRSVPSADFSALGLSRLKQLFSIRTSATAYKFCELGAGRVGVGGAGIPS